MPVSILAIESSCDETSASVCTDGNVLSNIVVTQSIHKEYGGVVPELASRAHMQNIVPAVSKSLKEANLKLSDLKAVAYTAGPGLLGALLVGSSFAKSLSFALNVPTVEVNHMQAHVLAHFIKDPKPKFPFLCLTVSGGHTQIVLVRSFLEMEVIGQTIDDAVGEAFDKGAKLMGLPYPGGPLVDQHAKKGDPHKFKFAESEVSDLNFSFSGIKTGLLYFLRKEMQKDPDFLEKNLKDLCAGYQQTLINMLLRKLTKASKELGISNIGIAGGVSANSALRSALISEGMKRGWEVFVPDFEYCTDNAGMIAIAGYYRFLSGEFGNLRSSPQPRMTFR